MTDWGGFFSLRKGFPGTAFIRKNVSVATAKMVSSAISTRFKIYFAILSLPKIHLVGMTNIFAPPRQTVCLFYRKLIVPSRFDPL